MADVCTTCHVELCETCHACRCDRGADNTCGAANCPGTRIKHSGPETRFCVLCLSGEHERVDEAVRMPDPCCTAPACADCAPDSECCETVCGVCPCVSAADGCTMTPGELDGTRSCREHGMYDMEKT